MTDGAIEPAEDQPRKPFWAKCEACGHCWPVAYYPMEVGRFARIVQRAAICPMCGAEGKQVVVALQEDGRLIEKAGP